MFKLYLTLSTRYIKEHKLRSFLSFISIVFSIALILSTTVLNKAFTDSYKSMIDKLTGKSQVVARGDSAGFSVENLDKMQKVDGVKKAIPSVQGITRLYRENQTINLYLLGIDPEIDGKVRDYRLEKGNLPFKNDKSVVITKNLAGRYNYKIGDSVEMLTVQGKEKFRIAGILKDTGTARANGGNVALVNIKDAQVLNGLEGKYNFIDFTLEDKYKAAQVMPKLKKAAEGRMNIEQPAQRGQETEKLVSAMSFTSNFLSFSALLVSVFLMLNTIMVAVRERRKEIGTLRALGFQRGQITRLFITEAAVMSTLGSIVGVLYGILVLGALEGTFMQLFKWFVRVDKINVQVSAGNIISCLVLGIVVSLLAAWYPAREGAKAPPVKAMKESNVFPESRTFNLKFWLGLAIFVIAMVKSIFYSKNMYDSLIFFAALIGLTLMMPAFIKLGVRLLAGVANLFFGAFGKLACLNMDKTNQRTAITVSSLMIGITIVLGMCGYIASTQKTLDVVMASDISGDVLVRSGSDVLMQSDVPMQYDLKKEMQSISGVAKIEVDRQIKYTYHGEPIRIQAREQRASHLYFRNGNRDEINKRLLQGDGIIISESFETIQGVHMGDRLELDTPAGKKKFQVVGVYLEASSMRGSLGLEYDQFNQLWHDYKVDGFSLYLKKGYDAERVKKEIIQRLQGKQQIIVQTNVEYSKEVHKIVYDAMGSYYLLELMTLVVAFMGVFNTLMISILERTKEIGILRAIGSLRWEIKKMLLIESALIGISGVIFGTIMGSYMSYYIVQITKIITGYHYIYSYPLSFVLNVAAVSIAIALVAGLYPARRAARMNIVNAIEYE